MLLRENETSGQDRKAARPLDLVQAEPLRLFRAGWDSYFPLM